jgi:hypothetical protein
MATVHVAVTKAAKTRSSAPISSVMSRARIARTVVSSGASEIVPDLDAEEGEVILVTALGGDIFVHIDVEPEAGEDAGFVVPDGATWPYVADEDGVRVAIKDVA